MGKALIIGCGGVASVAIHKCCQNSEVFEEICIASRTVSKCDALKEKLQRTTKTKITTAQVNADNVEELIDLINREKPDVVLNLALPDDYIEHGSVDVLRREVLLDAPSMMKRIVTEYILACSRRTAGEKNDKRQTGEQP